ncbi:MAG: HYR domain-containing protein [Candidatus Moraniibacteriota bacterium]
MKIIKKITKKSKGVAEKILYSFMVMMMALQPVSAPGILRAIATDEVTEEAVPAPASDSTSDSREEPKEEMKEDPKTEVAEKSIPAPKEESAVEAVVPVEEATPIVEETTAVPTETTETTDTDTDTEKIEITGEGQITPEAASIVVPEKETPIGEGSENDTTKGEEVKKDIWSVDGDKATTNDSVEKDVKYVAPQNEEVSVTFTKLPENPGKLSIEEIELTDEQVASLNALSNKAYDITSDMEDGTFEYDLTLPKPADRDDVQIRYAEKESELEDAKTVSKDDTKIEDEKISANLDHFTIFYVGMNPSTSVNSWAGEDFIWMNAGNAKISDNQYATTIITNTGHVSNHLKVSNFGFSVPAEATIMGIQVSIERKASASIVQDYLVKLVDDDGTIVGSNHAHGEYWPTSDAVATYGGPADLWGTAWTPEQVNDDDFGVILSVKRSNGGSQIAYVDSIRVEIAYAVTSPACSPDNFIYTKDSDFSDDKVDINFSNGNTRISVLAGSGYEVTKVELDVNGDGYGGYHTYATGPVNNYNPPGGNIDNARITIQRVCNVPSDTTPPVLNLPADMISEATSSSGAVVSFSVTATDTDPANPVVTCVPASGSTFPMGATTVNCSATDTAGNTSTGSFVVTVRDTTPPAISGVPANITTKTNDSNGKSVSYALPTANDAVDGTVEVTCDPASDSIFPVGTTTVNCSASDVAGNTSNRSFNVKVELATGTIKVIKDLRSNLGFDSGRFNLLIDETIKGINKGDNGTTGTQTVIVGTHSVSEEAYGATDLADYTSSIRCTRQEIDYCHYGHCHYETVEVSSGLGTSLSRINVGEDEDVTCTIQNIRNTGTIKVVKNLNPSDDEGKFNLKIDGDIERLLAGDGDSTWKKTVKAGTHSVSETGSGAWWWGHWHPATSLSNYASSIECKNGDAIIASGVGTSLSDITVNKDEDIICTITNTRYGSINVHKFNDLNNNRENDDEPSLEGWQMGIYAGSDCQGQVISDGMKYTNSNGNALFEKLVPGDYSIKEENVFAGWKNTTGICQNKTIAAGENANVEVGNVELSDIHGMKWSDADGDGIKDETESLLSGWTINLYKSNGEGYDSEPIETMNTDSSEQHFGWYWFENLVPGKYKVCEVQKEGWKQTFPNDNSCHEIILPDSNPNSYEKMENYIEEPEPVYNFGNQQLGKITIIKRTERDTHRKFPFSSSFAGSFSLGQNDVWSSEFLAPGTYSVSEGSLHSDHWSFDKIRCSDSTNLATFVKNKKTVTINLAPGSLVTCKYDNDYSRNEDENDNEDAGVVAVVSGIIPGGTTQTNQETQENSNQESDGEEVKGAQSNPEVAGTEKKCSEWPLWVWILLLLAYVGIFSFSTFNKYKERKNLPWVSQAIELAVILAIWYFYETCRLYKWFPWTAIALGAIIYAILYFAKKKATKQPEIK